MRRISSGSKGSRSRPIDLRPPGDPLNCFGQDDKAGAGASAVKQVFITGPFSRGGSAAPATPQLKGSALNTKATASAANPC